MAADAAATTSGVGKLEFMQAGAAIDAQAGRVDAQDALLGEARGIPVCVARVAAEIVVGVEVLNLDIVVGWKSAR